MTAKERGAFFDQAREHTPLLGVTTPDGLSFIVSTEDASVGRALFTWRTRSEFRMLATALKVLRAHGVPRRGIFVDVGANIGTTTVAALVQHRFSEAVAFEPEPRNVSLLLANLALNDVASRVRVVEAAVSDSVGTRNLAISPKHGGHRIRKTGWPVEAVTLDREIDSDVGLIWIDVQGHEGQVFKGARRLLARRPPVVVEVNPAELRMAGTYEEFLEIARSYRNYVTPKGKRPLVQPTSTLEAAHLGGGKGHVDILLIP